jgi:predicted PurR-regulated permease PerM
LLLFAILAAGTLLGPVGVFLAAPLTILVYILIVTFYVRGALGEDATAPGEE